MFAISILLLLVMAYSKTTSQKYNLNTAIKTRLIAPQNSGFMQIKTQSDWYTWAESALLDSIKVFDTLNEPSKHQVRSKRRIYFQSYVGRCIGLRFSAHLSVCSDLSNCCISCAQLSQINSIYSNEVHIIFWSDSLCSNDVHIIFLSLFIEVS